MIHSIALMRDCRKNVEGFSQSLPRPLPRRVAEKDLKSGLESPWKGFRKSLLLCPALTLATLVFLPSFLSAAPTLGWIPVQQATAGSELVLDMHRFYQADGDASVTVAPASGFTARFDVPSFTLHVWIPSDTAGLVDLPMEAGNGSLKGVLTLAVQSHASHLFTFKPQGKITKAFVAGSFNGWSQDKTQLTGPDANGVYTARVPLDPGVYPYKFFVDGQWMIDPANQEKAGDSFGNSVLKIEGVSSTAPFIFADSLKHESLELMVIAGNSPVKKISALAELPDGTSTPLETDLKTNRITVVPRIKLPDSAWIRVVVADENGNTSNVVRCPLDNSGKFRWQDSVMYYAFTDRFFNGDKSNDKPIDDPNVLPPANYHGGDWRGIRQKIEEGYFDALSVNTIWLAPLNRNPDKAWQESPVPHRWYTGYHGYWPVSPTDTEPHFGDAKELKALIETAHKHGIKVIADLVLHHVHTDHPWWKEHRDWFGTLELPDGRQNLRLWEEQQFTTWFEPYLPSFNFENADAVKALIDNSAWWLNEYNLDGYRLDAVKHILPGFWWKFRDGLREQVEKKTGKPLYLVGETFKDRQGIMSFVGPNMLDGQFDFPLYNSIKDTFGTGYNDMKSLDASLGSSERIYGKETLMSSLIGNHDQGRFMAYADGALPDNREQKEEEIGWKYPPTVKNPASYKKIELAQAFLMSIDGVPMIYYGDEIGMTGAGDPDNRRDMRFGMDVNGDEKGVLENFKKLARARHDHPALRYGSRRTLVAEKDVYAFIRAHLADRVLCVFNRGAAAVDLKLKVAPEFADGAYTDLLSGQKWSVKNGGLSISVPAGTAAMVSPSGAL